MFIRPVVHQRFFIKPGLFNKAAYPAITGFTIDFDADGPVGATMKAEHVQSRQPAVEPPVVAASLRDRQPSATTVSATRPYTKDDLVRAGFLMARRTTLNLDGSPRTPE